MSVVQQETIDWGRIATVYAELFPETEFYLATCMRIHRAQPATGLIVDVGCGPGVLASLMAQPARRIIAIDADETMVRLASERTALLPGVEVRCGDARELSSLPDASVDGVNGSNLLCFFSPDEVRQILREVHRVLRPGGIFTTTGPHHGFDIGVLIQAAKQDFQRHHQPEAIEALEQALSFGAGVSPQLTRYSAGELAQQLIGLGFARIGTVRERIYAGQCHFVQAVR